ncbi:MULTISPECIES: polysaccharide biosynthesis C-terminal domain-containing protein, partial [Klebsiella]
NNYSLYFIVACCLSCFFTSLDVYSVYYDARLESKKNVFVNVLGLIVSLFLRWGIAVFKLDPVFLSIPIIFTGMFPYFFRMYLFRKNLGIRASNKKNKFKYIRFLIASGSSFVISSISVAIYTRVSLLLLGFFCGSSLLGIYSVAVSLATSWIFVCNSFITSNLPSIFSSNNELETIKITAKLNILVILIGCVVISFAIIGGHYGISLLYGKDYVLAYTPFVILCAATLFSSLGTIASRFIAKYSGYSYLSKKAFCVLILSIMLNVIFINLWGIIGAAIATLATEFISLTLLNYLFKGGIVLKLHAYKIFYRG